MEDQRRRVFAALSVIVVIWITVYWATDPDPGGDRVELSLADPPAQASSQPESEPESPPMPTPANRGQTPREQRPAPPPQQLTIIEPEDPTPVATAPTNAELIPPQFRDYTIQSGDTFESIARREFGASSKWTVIANANPYVDPRRIRPGRVIRIPLDPDNVFGQVEGQENTTPPSPVAEVIEYKVKPGDTLTEISKAYYGTTRYWRDIYGLNRDVLNSPESLRVGQTIRIPAKPPSSE